MERKTHDPKKTQWILPDKRLILVSDMSEEELRQALCELIDAVEELMDGLVGTFNKFGERGL